MNIKIFGFEHEIFIWESDKTKYHNLLEKIFFSFEYKTVKYMFSRWTYICTAAWMGFQIVADKVGCLFPMVVVFIPPHTEFRPNDHRDDAPHFTWESYSNLVPLVSNWKPDLVFIYRYEFYSLFEWFWYMLAGCEIGHSVTVYVLDAVSYCCCLDQLFGPWIPGYFVDLNKMVVESLLAFLMRMKSEDHFIRIN